MVVVYEVLSQELELVMEQFCWTDSTITLSWIKAKNLEFNMLTRKNGITADLVKTLQI